MIIDEMVFIRHCDLILCFAVVTNKTMHGLNIFWVTLNKYDIRFPLKHEIVKNSYRETLSSQ